VWHLTIDLIVCMNRAKSMKQIFINSEKQGSHNHNKKMACKWMVLEKIDHSKFEVLTFSLFKKATAPNRRYIIRAYFKCMINPIRPCDGVVIH
jgi:hypothetical protein